MSVNKEHDLSSSILYIDINLKIEDKQMKNRINNKTM